LLNIQLKNELTRIELGRIEREVVETVSYSNIFHSILTSKLDGHGGTVATGLI
jgi:hypothetical protein